VDVGDDCLVQYGIHMPAWLPFPCRSVCVICRTEPIIQKAATMKIAVSGDHRWFKTRPSDTIVSIVILNARASVHSTIFSRKLNNRIKAIPGHTNKTQKARNVRIGVCRFVMTEITITSAENNIKIGQRYFFICQFTHSIHSIHSRLEIWHLV
jgi:hypothetical protein